MINIFIHKCWFCAIYTRVLWLAVKRQWEFQRPCLTLFHFVSLKQGLERSDVETSNYETTPEHSDREEDDGSYETVNFLAKSPNEEKADKKAKPNDDVYAALDPNKRKTENDYETLGKFK